jgi:hypothetical protein
MIENSEPRHVPKGRLIRLPPRKGIWLYNYEDVRFLTPFQGMAISILGISALIFGTVVLWLAWKSKTRESIVFVFAIGALAYGLISAPVGIIFLLRRKRRDDRIC